MRDSDEEYPLKQPQRRQHAFDDFADDDNDLARQPIIQQAPLHQRDEVEQPRLPRGRLGTTLAIALAAGIIASLLNIIVTLANAGVYRQAASSKYAANPSSLPISVATTIFGLFCLTSVISLAIFFIAGFITGKVAVARRMGFLCGFVTGAITLIIGYVAQHFPNYPGAVAPGISSGLPGLGGATIVSIVLVVIVSLIAGLIGLFGAWLATRRHPYYAGYDA